MPGRPEMTVEEEKKAYGDIRVVVKKCISSNCDGDVICESKWIPDTSVPGWLDRKKESRMCACNKCDVVYNASADICSRAIAIARCG